MSMRTITNAFQDIHIVDLDPTPARGPFVATQSGTAPDDLRQHERLFVLRRDGRWVDFNYYLASGRPELWDECVFETTQEIMALIQELPPKPVVADLPVSEAGLQAWLAQNPPGTVRDHFARWTGAYWERHRPQ